MELNSKIQTMILFKMVYYFHPLNKDVQNWMDLPKVSQIYLEEFP